MAIPSNAVATQLLAFTPMPIVGALFRRRAVGFNLVWNCPTLAAMIRFRAQLLSS
jgi:hypothetical protein